MKYREGRYLKHEQKKVAIHFLEKIWWKDKIGKVIALVIQI